MTLSIHHIQPLVAVLALALLALPAHAAKPIDQRHPLDQRGRVEIDNLKGSVDVRVWDRPEVRITGTLGDGVEKFWVDGDRSELRIEVKYPNRARNTEPTHLVVQVPLQVELEVNTVSADINVHGVAANEVSLESVSGDIVANGAPSSASVESVSGDLRLTFNTRSVDASTVSGDLALSGRMNGEASIETVSGNVRFDSLGERMRKLSVGTVSGDIGTRFALSDDAQVRMESVSGDLDLSMPRGLSAVVSGESFSGDLDAPGAKIDREEFGPGSSFRTRYGAGKGDIRLETFSGDVALRWY